MERQPTGTTGTLAALDQAKQHADIHRVLANPRRLMILSALAERELSVGQIAERIGASLQSTSQHLRLLREHALVCSRREGQTVYYRARLEQESPDLSALCGNLLHIKEMSHEP
jgi:DNA-binding transcriptional ArsR family regulator